MIENFKKVCQIIAMQNLQLLLVTDEPSSYLMVERVELVDSVQSILARFAKLGDRRKITGLLHRYVT
jgi:hypothetical protein